MKITKPKKLEKHIVKEFIQLFKMKYQKHWNANRLIKTVSEGSRLNGAYRCGLTKGISDFLFDYPDVGKEIIVYNCNEGIPVTIRDYRNLWIEFKRPGNKQTPEQIQFQESREQDGSKYIVCYSADEAMEQIKLYLGG